MAKTMIKMPRYLYKVTSPDDDKTFEVTRYTVVEHDGVEHIQHRGTLIPLSRLNDSFSATPQGAVLTWRKAKTEWLTAFSALAANVKRHLAHRDEDILGKLRLDT